MGNHEQTHWQHYLADQTRRLEGTPHSQIRSLRFHEISSSTPHIDDSPSSPGMLNQQQIFQRLGAMSLSSYRSESPQLLDPPVVLSQPENVQAMQWLDNELEACLAQGSFPWEASEQHKQADNERPLVHDSQRFAQVEAQEHAPVNTTETENTVRDSAQQFANMATNLDQNREEGSDSQSHHERSSRPDRASQELQNIAQAYITAGNHKNLPADIKADIKACPFTKTELQELTSHLKTAQNETQIDKATRKRLSKIIQRQSKSGKRKAQIYEQSENRKTQIQIYEQSENRKILKAKFRDKEIDAQILTIEGVEAFKVQDFGVSSHHFIPAERGSFAKFSSDLQIELPLSDQEEE